MVLQEQLQEHVVLQEQLLSHVVVLTQEDVLTEVLVVLLQALQKRLLVGGYAAVLTQDLVRHEAAGSLRLSARVKL